ncbi:MAG TPA: ankyrin repeat domain-containing protein [Pyrinomonadaceae bacterium]|nr:ankyrin repeat domain-containing protein [Pyrinomonadaceae bacterium]
MKSVITKKILWRAIAFSATAIFSVAMMNSLPRIRQQRQRSFTRATMDGNLRRMRWLHFTGAKIDAPTSLGNPLFLAASEGKLKTVRYLLDEGADVNARAAGGSTALTEAAYKGHLEVIKELLLRGAEINVVSQQGTALDIALNRKNTAAAELLRHLGGKTASELRTGG